MKDKTNPNFDRFSEFCDSFSMSNLVEYYTCFTKTHKSSIDFILTNKVHWFQLTKTAETGISDIHLLILTFMKAQTTCLPPKKVVYRDFKNFNETAFLEDVKLKKFSWKSDDSNENFFYTSFNLWFINTHPSNPKFSEEMTLLL